MASDDETVGCSHDWGDLSLALGPVVREVCVRCGAKRERLRPLTEHDARLLRSLRVRWDGP